MQLESKMHPYNCRDRTIGYDIVCAAMGTVWRAGRMANAIRLHTETLSTIIGSDALGTHWPAMRATITEIRTPYGSLSVRQDDNMPENEAHLLSSGTISSGEVVREIVNFKVRRR